MKFTLRPASIDDREFVESTYFETQQWIIERLFPWRGETTEREMFAKSYNEADSHVIVVDGTDIGWLTIERRPREIHLEAVYILPGGQRRGIGTALLRRLKHEADTALVPLRLSTAKINPAQELYKRLGFVVTHEDRYKVYMEYTSGAPSP